jgi:hypothetical protein
MKIEDKTEFAGTPNRRIECTLKKTWTGING